MSGDAWQEVQCAQSEMHTLLELRRLRASVSGHTLPLGRTRSAQARGFTARVCQAMDPE